jgi:hypothetical protein
MNGKTNRPISFYRLQSALISRKGNHLCVCERLLLFGGTKPLSVEDRRRKIKGSTVVKPQRKIVAEGIQVDILRVSTISVEYSENLTVTCVCTDKRQNLTV